MSVLPECDNLSRTSASRWKLRLVGVFADVAQLVARNLAKVQVAGSIPVVRSLSKMLRSKVWWSGREARLGTANPATRVQIPSPPQLFNANDLSHAKALIGTVSPA